jgi:predicted HD phosphohydrolase|tara:strand:- start:123 stop:668 length:546 start_codon:yes stop_codon:yes gene_type:complete
VDIVDKIIRSYQTNNNLYIGEKVTMSEHMIQSAMLAEEKNSSKSLICACLFHDYGHFIIENPDLLVSKSLDGKHENVAFDFLNDYFKPEVTEPVKLHVQAKRYLARDKSYYDILSKASKVSLKLQGGIMSDEEAQNFTSFKFYRDAIMLRKYDDDGKMPNVKIKKIDEYRDLILSQLKNNK